MSQLTDDQRATLRAVCDTVVPSIPRAADPDGFFARTASDVGVPDALEGMLGLMAPEQVAGFAELLDALAAQGFAAKSQASREQLMRNVALLGGAAAVGVGALQQLTLFLHYGLPDPTGQNPSWKAFGFPGPTVAPPRDTKTITPLEPEGDAVTLEADVVVVGSGAGGGVIAGTLARQGAKVVVLELGGYVDESDFDQLEIPAYQRSYWRGGPHPTADMNISLQAGSCLGGGTTINWTNSLRTKPWVREEWADKHGLAGLDGPDFDAHLDAVWERLSVNGDCSDYNGPTQRMKEGADALGLHWHRCDRNTDPATYDPATAGMMGFGDVSGSKQGTLKTYLQDAFDHGADILVRTSAERVLVEDGRAAGVSATWVSEDGSRTCAVTVRAPQVVVAAGALESPALLLRSRIGGPAVGQNLRLHPCTAFFGVYSQDQQAWWGAPHTGLVDEFAHVRDGHGFLIEGAQYTTAVAGSALPFTDATVHKEMMSRFREGATFIGLLRDHGSGQVTIDANGVAVPWYSLTDPLDVELTHQAMEVQIRMHEAAGAREIHSMAAGDPKWRRGDDLGLFIARCRRVPLRAGGQRLFSAHQMGTCRMGADPETSVAGPWGELHDTPGVWIGDGSAFPSASGTNPMITIMALAHRTAGAIAGDRSRTTATPVGAAK